MPVENSPFEGVGIMRGAEGTVSVEVLLRMFPAPPMPDFV